MASQIVDLWNEFFGLWMRFRNRMWMIEVFVFPRVSQGFFQGSPAGSSAQDSAMIQGKRKWQDVGRSDLAEAGGGTAGDTSMDGGVKASWSPARENRHPNSVLFSRFTFRMKSKIVPSIFSTDLVQTAHNMQAVAVRFPCFSLEETMQWLWKMVQDPLGK